MKIIRDFEKIPEKTSVAVGYFDGMHRGHACVLNKSLSLAHENSISSALLTFDLSSIRPAGKGGADLLSSDFRQERAREMGFDYYIILDFPKIKDLDENAFVSDIIGPKFINASYVVCGDDFRFAKNRAGDVTSLKTICAKLGINVCPVSCISLDGDIISTTRIKALLKEGNIREVNNLLGFTYCIEGTVSHGNHIAHSLGFPTANVDLNSSLVCPKKGVYVSRVMIDNSFYTGITNIGTRPTVTEDVLPVCETHILDFSEDIYGKEIKIFLYDFLREEKHFDSLDDLTAAISENVNSARIWAQKNTN